MHFATILPQSYLNLTLLFAHLQLHILNLISILLYPLPICSCILWQSPFNLISVLLLYLLILKFVLWQSYLNLISILFNSLHLQLQIVNLSSILSWSYFPLHSLSNATILPRSYFTFCILATTYSDNLTSILSQSYFPLCIFSYLYPTSILVPYQWWFMYI